MDTLTYKNLFDQFDPAEKFEIPAHTQPAAVEVAEHKDGVMLTVSGQPILLTIIGARRLAVQLRRAADNMDRFRKGKAKRGKR